MQQKSHHEFEPAPKRKPKSIDAFFERGAIAKGYNSISLSPSNGSASASASTGIGDANGISVSASGCCSDTVSEGIGNIDKEQPEPAGSNRRRKKFSQVWTYFKKSEDKKWAKCLECGKECQTSGNTSNLHDHLKRFHPSLTLNAGAGSSTSTDLNNCLNVAEPESEAEYCQFTCRPSTTTSVASTISMTGSKRSVDYYFKRAILYDKNCARKKDIDNVLMQMVAEDLQPFNIVENGGFKRFVKILDPRYELPSKTTLRNVLMRNLYDSLKGKLHQILSNNVKHVGITCDCWTSAANEGYLTVTCHFIGKNFDLQRAVLSTKKLLDSTNHNAQNIADSLKSVLCEWSIFDKVSGIVTDNAATMTKACDLLKKDHLPCFAHTLNLVVQDSLSKNTYLAPLISKCKGIVTFFKSSVIAYEKFKKEQQREKPLSLLQDVATRWNSTYLMIKRILMTNDDISKVLLSTVKAPAALTADEINILNDMEKLLAPFQNATEQISGSKYVTVSMSIPIAYGLSRHLTAAQLNNEIVTPEGKHLCNLLIESMKTRLYPYESKLLTKMGTILDPRFKKEGFQSTTNANQAATSLETEVKNICAYHARTRTRTRTHPAETEISNNNNLTETENSIEKQPSLFQFIESRISEKVQSSRVDAIIMIRQYFEKKNAPQDADPLLFWKICGNEFEALRECAVKYLCVPATSVESERIFSSAGLIISDRRTRLKPTNVDMLIFLNKNNWISKY